jgi:hypothetical protein
MADDQDQLRHDIDRRREAIGRTVNQIENRVHPGHVMGRRQDRVRRRLTDWKDTVFGNDEPDYPGAWYGYKSDDESSLADHGRNQVHAVADTAREMPRRARRQAQGNPVAAGVIALGAGWLVGSLLPESRQERRLARRVEPELAGALSTARDEAKGVAQEMQDTARDAAEQVEDRGREAAQRVKDHGEETARDLKNRSST